MKAVRWNRTVLGVLLIASSCAVVDSISGGLRAVGRWAEGFARGEGDLRDGRQEGEWTYTYDDGSIRARGGYKDDAQDGAWVYYYPSGEKEYEGTFRDERREGLFRYWHPSGSPRTQGHFVEGREQGFWMFWDAQGQLQQRGQYLEGLQVHRWSYNHPDGTKSAEGLFWDDDKVGRWSFWNASGEVEQKDFELPEGLAFGSETWPDGARKREGFKLAGKKEGLWLTYHRNGKTRMSGHFEDGRSTGRWFSYRASGELLAAGAVENGRPSGTWLQWSPSGVGSWSASGTAPAAPTQGEWSAAALADEAGLGDLLVTWLAEADEDLPDSALQKFDAPAVGEVSEELLAAISEEPDVPVNAQPWTEREQDEYEEYVDAYTEVNKKSSRLSSSYGGSSSNSKSKEKQRPTGDQARGAKYLGKPLNLMVFKAQDGEAFDLDSLKGSRVVLVVLRGFAGGLCVYCSAQTEALCDSGAFERFEKLNTKLLVVFPGGKNGMEAFKRGFEALGGQGLPPYGLLYERDIIVGKMLSIIGQKVIPSTFILDEEGIVQFAYVGEHIADRPPVDLLFEELEKIGPAQ